MVAAGSDGEISHLFEGFEHGHTFIINSSHYEGQGDHCAHTHTPTRYITRYRCAPRLFPLHVIYHFRTKLIGEKIGDNCSMHHFTSVSTLTVRLFFMLPKK